MNKCIGKFSLLLRRLRDACMDMLLLSTMNEERRQIEYLDDVKHENEERQRRNTDILGPSAPETRGEWYATQMRLHDQLFPFSESLTSLMYIVASDLSEVQRERVISYLSLSRK